MTSPAAIAESPPSAVGSGKRPPLERLELLCDAGSFKPIRSAVLSPRLGARAADGDGIVAGLGSVEGRPVACYAQDVRFLCGSLGAAQADTIDRVMQLAERLRLPVVGFIESAGARVQEGTAALAGYGRVFRRNVALSGVVPQISIIGGLAAGGACYSPALTDFVVMTKDAAMFLTGPGVVREVAGEDVSSQELGGHRVHERNGVADLVVADDRAAALLARQLLGYLPQHAACDPPLALTAEPERGDPGAELPDSPRVVYDVRSVIAGIADAGSVLEVGTRWGRSILTALARCDGRPVAIVASQPRHLGGVLDVDSSQKAARFVETCDAFGLPLIVLVDTPGFMPGVGQEKAGVIRFGSTLVRAFAAASVPRITVVLRKAYGGAFIAMNSKDLGADLVLAWPGAEIGVMGAHSATGIVHRREWEIALDPVAEREALAAAYSREHLSADAAARGGFVDEVIEPGDTRARLVWALGSMEGCGGTPSRGH
jgi:acetyl-CoA carboxylase carboxyltransferase component